MPYASDDTFNGHWFAPGEKVRLHYPGHIYDGQVLTVIECPYPDPKGEHACIVWLRTDEGRTTCAHIRRVYSA